MVPTQPKKRLWIWHVLSPSDRADVSILNAIERNEGQLVSTLTSDSSAQAQLQAQVHTQVQAQAQSQNQSQTQAHEPETSLVSLSRNQLKKLIDDGKVTVDQKPIRANQKLKSGSTVEVEIPAPIPTELVPENRPLEILFEDEYLLVLNKPPGLTVHPSPTQMEGTLVHALLHHVQDLSGIGGVLRPGIVHRIDKNTSGALLITKTDLAHQKLSETFSKHEIERSYWALCYGSPGGSDSSHQSRTGQTKMGQKTRIESLIGRNPTDRKKMSMTVKEGRKAISYFRRIEEYGIPAKKAFGSWLEVTLETGRTHQVRVHLTGIGHSILGDPTYGTPSAQQPKWQSLPQDVKAAVLTLPGQALHARVLGFQHPITGQPLRFEAEPPHNFTHLLKILKNYTN